MRAIRKPTVLRPRWNSVALIRRGPAHRAFLVADPPLKQVVSRTVEAGLRGTQELNIGSLGWKLGAFRADNNDDILATPIPGLRVSAFSRTSARRAARVSRPKSP